MAAFMTSDSNVQLRRRLTEMTESGTEPSTHTAQLGVISKNFPNTIRILESRLQENRYTCGMYVFDLSEDDDYIAIAGLGLPNVHAGRAFFEWLVASRLLEEIDEHDAHGGDLIMYFENGQWQHVGFWRLSRRVESKWGLGLLYNHGTWEVPEHYGGQVRFFRSISPEAAIEHFIRYAQACGAPVQLTG
jgi:hypothetical protein